MGFVSLSARSRTVIESGPPISSGGLDESCFFVLWETIA